MCGFALPCGRNFTYGCGGGDAGEVQKCATWSPVLPPQSFNSSSSRRPPHRTATSPFASRPTMRSCSRRSSSASTRTPSTACCRSRARRRNGPNHLVDTILADPDRFDIIAINEAWDEDAKSILVRRLRPFYPELRPQDRRRPDPDARTVAAGHSSRPATGHRRRDLRRRADRQDQRRGQRADALRQPKFPSCRYRTRGSNGGPGPTSSWRRPPRRSPSRCSISAQFRIASPPRVPRLCASATCRAGASTTLCSPTCKPTIRKTSEFHAAERGAQFAPDPETDREDPRPACGAASSASVSSSWVTSTSRCLRPAPRSGHSSSTRRRASSPGRSTMPGRGRPPRRTGASPTGTKRSGSTTSPRFPGPTSAAAWRGPCACST